VHQKTTRETRDEILKDDVLSLVLMVGTFMVSMVIALESTCAIMEDTLSMGRHIRYEHSKYASSAKSTRDAYEVSYALHG
jgi:hypothetical protein